jgi:hypothetical protein
MTAYLTLQYSTPKDEIKWSQRNEYGANILSIITVASRIGAEFLNPIHYRIHYIPVV